MTKTIEAPVSYFPIQRPFSRLTNGETETLLARLEPEERSLVDKVETMVSEYDKVRVSYMNRSFFIKIYGYAIAVGMLVGAASAIREYGSDPFSLTILGIGTALGLASIYLDLKFVSPIRRKAKELRLEIISEQVSPEYERCAAKLETLQLLALPEPTTTTHRTIARRLLSQFSRLYS